MADDGGDNEMWEDASDIFEVRSEAEISGSGENDDIEASSVPTIAPPLRKERVEGWNRRGPDRVPDRFSDRIVDQRGTMSELPHTVYGMAPSSNRSEPVPPNERSLPVRPDKPTRARAFIKPSRFEGGNNCLESHLVQFDIVAKHNGWDESEKAYFLKVH